MLNDQEFMCFYLLINWGNQGKFKEHDVKKFHNHMENKLAKLGGHFDDIQYCPYHIDGTVTRYKKTLHIGNKSQG